MGGAGELRDADSHAASVPLDDATGEQPPLIRRAEVVAFSLVGLLVICVVAVLYVARGFFLPIVTALVIGTMLSPAAKFLERFRIPRPISAVLIVTATCAALAFMIALISAPVMEWTTRLPELGTQLKDKFHVFDRPLALWHQLQNLFGMQPAEGGGFQLPKIEWVQPTLEFLSPTFTEILLFFAVLVLFIASWPDLRRALVLNFSGHETRLRTLRILNAIESALGSYLLTKGSHSFLNLELDAPPEWWPEYAIPIGTPLQPTPSDISSLAQGSLYRRGFSGGFVLVNPADSGAPVTVSLSGTYNRVTPVGGGEVPESGIAPGSLVYTAVSEVTLPPKTAAVLLNR